MSTATYPHKTIPRYGITERKKAELDNLSLEVIDAQYNVNKFQSIVTSLSAKVSNFQVFLATAENTRTQTFNNNNLMNQLVQSALDLQNNSKVAFDEVVEADEKTKELGSNIKQVIDKLIYATEVLNRLVTIVTRKKALNPLISDDLMGVLATAGKDANNAVALTLIALRSTFAAQSSNMESGSALGLTYTEAAAFYKVLVGEISDGQDAPPNAKATPTEIAAYIKDNCFSALIYTAYKDAKAKYSRIEHALTTCTSQLSDAKSDLAKAQIKLQSLQSSLSAATAAALAS